MNLITLEVRKHRTLIIALLLVAFLWAAWMVRELLSGEALLTLALNLGSLSLLGLVGILVPIVLARSLGSEAGGPLAFLLTSPRSGWAHVLARSGVALTTLAIYYGMLAAVSAWVASSLGVSYDAWVPWAAWGYAMVAIAAPTVFLAIVYGLLVAAYRPGRGGQLPAVASVFGVFGIWGWFSSWSTQHLTFLPQIPIPHLTVPREVARLLGTQGEVDLQSSLQFVFGGIPTAPVLVGLLLAALLAAVAARLWEEVEWA